MATNLTGLKVKDTYNSLLKIGDNSSLSATPDKISDGLGNESILYLSTSQVSIGTIPATGYDLTVNSATKTGSLDVVGAATAASLRLTGGSGSQGTLSWNTDEETVDIIQNGAVLQLGQEMHVHVKNQTGSTINDGTPVYVTGTLGASGRLTVAPMIADGSIEAKYFLGVTTEDIPNGEDGKVTTFGKIRGLNTSAYSEGQTLYVSASTAGYWQTTPPAAPALDLEVAIVINSHANNGTLFIRAQNGYYLGMLHDVYLNNVTANQVLAYNGINNRWENLSDLSLGNLTLSGYLRGAANFVIDPAAHGDETGVVQILGDLRVDGTTTTINSTTVTIDDKNIVLASGSATAADANGAGLTIDGANATMTYVSASDRFVFNKHVEAQKIIAKDGTSSITLDPTLQTSNYALTIGVTDDGIKFQHNSNSRGFVFDRNGTELLNIASNGNSTFFGNVTAPSFIGSLTGAASLNVLKAGDTMTGNLDFNDNVQARFGTGDDFKIYHNATNTLIDNETGAIIIRNFADDQDIVLASDDGAGSITDYLRVDGSEGSVKLFHYGSQKLETTSTGVSITGALSGNISTSSISGGTIDINGTTAINLQYNGLTQLRIDSLGVAYLGTVTFANDGISLTDEDSTTDSFFHANVDYDAGLYTVTSNARYGSDYIQVDGKDSRSGNDRVFVISPKDIGDPDPDAILYLGGDHSITAPNTLVDWHTIEMNALSVQINNAEVATRTWVTSNTTLQDVTDRGATTTNSISTGRISLANNVSTGGFSNASDFQILLYDTGTVTRNYGIGIESDTFMFNSDSVYKFYVDNGAIITFNDTASNWNTSTQGTSVGSIHLDPNNSGDHFGSAITFGASDSGNGTDAQAGIYVRSDGSYGTKMYISTTDSYASGSKTAISISHNGTVNFDRQTPTVQGSIMWHDGNDGSGSGLDADRVDGYEANQFLRADTNDEKTGWLKVYSAIGAGDNVRTGIGHYDTTAMAAGVGGQLVVGYKYTSAGDYTEGAIIKMFKENGTSGQYGSGLKFQVRNHAEDLNTKMRLSPSGKLSLGDSPYNGGVYAFNSSTEEDENWGMEVSWSGSPSTDYSTKLKYYPVNGESRAAGIWNSATDSYTLYSNSNTNPNIIIPNGYLGVGQSSPSHKIHVESGNIGIRNGSFHLGNISSGGTDSIHFYKEDGANNLRLYRNMNAFGGSSGAAYANLELYSGSSYATRIAGSGHSYFNNGSNVGIGTSSPAYTLTVDGNIKINHGNNAANYYLWLNKNGANDGGILFQRDNSLDWQQVNSTGSGDLNFYSYGTSSNALTLKRSNGNIGIGQTNPSERLEVSGNVKINSNTGIRINNYTSVGTTASGAMSIFGHNVHVDSANNKVIASNTGYYAQWIKMYYNQGITFHTSSTTVTSGVTMLEGTGANSYERMRITNEGEVYFNSDLRNNDQALRDDILNIRGRSSGQYIRMMAGDNGFGIVDSNWSSTVHFRNMNSYGHIYHNNGNDIKIGNGTDHRTKLTGQLMLGVFSQSQTNTGDAWFGRAGDRAAGSATIQLGTNTSSKFEIVDYSWSNVLFEVNHIGDLYAKRTITSAANAVYSNNYYNSNGTYNLSPATQSNIQSLKLRNNANFDIYDVSNNAFIHCDARAEGSYAAAYKYTSKDSSGYGSYKEYWWDGNSYQSISQESDSFRFSAPLMSANSTYNNPDFLVVRAGDYNWTYGSYSNDSSIYWMQVKFYGNGDDNRGFRVLDANGGTVRFRVNGLGNGYFTGDVVAYSSDARLKDNVKNIDNALDKVMSLNGVTFDWNDKAIDAGFIPKQRYNDAGVLAQEVQAVLPQAVDYAPFDQHEGKSKSGEDYLTVQYEKLVPLLIESIKELKQEIDELKAKLNA